MSSPILVLSGLGAGILAYLKQGCLPGQGAKAAAAPRILIIASVVLIDMSRLLSTALRCFRSRCRSLKSAELLIRIVAACVTAPGTAPGLVDQSSSKRKPQPSL